MNHQAYQGKLRYSSDLQVGFHQLLVAVPCRVGDLADRVHALLDTGSMWCVLPAPMAEALGYELPEEGSYHLHTRFGTFAGELVRERVAFSPDEARAERSGQSGDRGNVVPVKGLARPYSDRLERLP